MTNKPHRDRIKLRKSLLDRTKDEIYTWLVTYGYFPEAYVIPPCFWVASYPSPPSYFYEYKEKKQNNGNVRYDYNPQIHQLCDLHFPKSKLTDRTFSIIHPKIHSDIALIYAENWKEIVALCLGDDSAVYSYSFPEIPGVATKSRTRSGRGIYTFTRKFENALIAEAYRYRFLLRSDVKNCYPSIYTHSIAWACHGYQKIRDGNRQNYSLFGNRLDKLFQNANDSCTNGIPIGPAVSDIICEIILSAVDRDMTTDIKARQALVVRYKDDYRFLCKSYEDCSQLIKTLQSSLKKFHLLPNEEKTVIVHLPEGLFREWRHEYDLAVPDLEKKVTQKIFKNWYQSVLRIDKKYPGSGIIDRFISDLHQGNKTILPLSLGSISQSISLLLLLAERRVKSFPNILGLLEIMMLQAKHRKEAKEIVFTHLKAMLFDIAQDENNNRYLIGWIVYFLRFHKADFKVLPSFKHPILLSIYKDKNKLFDDSRKSFCLYRSLKETRQAGGLLHHLNPFRSEGERDVDFLEILHGKD